jgi:hypothetical protein
MKVRHFWETLGIREVCKKTMRYFSLFWVKKIAQGYGKLKIIVGRNAGQKHSNH